MALTTNSCWPGGLAIVLAITVPVSAPAQQSALAALASADGLAPDLAGSESWTYAVRRGTPGPLDEPATLSTADTVRAVSSELADSARHRFEVLTGLDGGRPDTALSRPAIKEFRGIYRSH